jgi:hypothetical protein
MKIKIKDFKLIYLIFKENGNQKLKAIYCMLQNKINIMYFFF